MRTMDTQEEECAQSDSTDVDRLETQDGSSTKSKSNIMTFVGPAATVFAHFDELSRCSLDQYCPNWRNHDQPRSHMIPPIFQYKNYNKSDDDVEAKRRGQTSNSSVPALVNHRSADEAEHWISKSISRLISDGFRAPFVAFRGLSVNNQYAKGQLIQLFPHLTTGTLSEFDTCLRQEFDYVLIGPKIGVVVIEVKSSKFERSRDFKHGSKSALPEDYKHGIDQVKVFDEFAKFVEKCDRLTLLKWPENFTIKKILFTPNLARKRFDDWMQRLDDEGRNHVMVKLHGIDRIFKEDLETLDEKMQQHLSSGTPIPSGTYESGATIMGGLASADVSKSNTSTQSSKDAKKSASSPTKPFSLDRSKLSEAAAILDETKCIDDLSMPAAKRDMCIFRTPAQQRALNGPPLQCIFGCAGTGKTLILRAKALQIVKSRQSVCVLTTDGYAPNYEQYFRDHDCSRTNNVKVSSWNGIRLATTKVCSVAFGIFGFKKEEKEVISTIEEFIETFVDAETFELREAESIGQEFGEVTTRNVQLLLAFLKANDSILIDDAADKDKIDVGPVYYERYAVLVLFVMARRLRPDKTLWIAFDPLYDLFYMDSSTDKSIAARNKLEFLDDEGCVIRSTYLNGVMRNTEEVHNYIYREWAPWTKTVERTYPEVSPSLLHKIHGLGVESTSISFNGDLAIGVNIVWDSIRTELDKLRNQGCEIRDMGIILVEEEDDEILIRNIKNIFKASGTRVYSGMETPSMEWPVVIAASYPTKRWLEEDGQARFAMYRACSRSTGKLIVFNFFTIQAWKE